MGKGPDGDGPDTAFVADEGIKVFRDLCETFDTWQIMVSKGF